MAVAGPTHDERSWTFNLDPGGRDPVLSIEHLEKAFPARFPDYDKGITVPAIVDIPTGQVVTNDVAQITLDFSTDWRQYHRQGAPDLYPDVRRDINPTGIVRCGPDLSGWLTNHGREALGGRPFGDGTPPEPPAPAEVVPADHTPFPN